MGDCLACVTKTRLIFCGVIVLITALRYTAAADIATEAEELFTRGSENYYAAIEEIGEELTDWCTRNLPAERAQEAIAVFTQDRVVLDGVRATLRAKLSGAQKKYRAVLKQVRGRIADQQLSQQMQHEEQRLLEEMRVRPRSGWYKVVSDLHKKSPARLYHLSPNNVGGYEIKAMPDPATNLKSSVGLLAWDEDKCIWSGSLNSVFMHDPQEKLRVGAIVLHPIDSLHFEADQTIHQWDGRGGDVRKVSGKAKWEWYKP